MKKLDKDAQSMVDKFLDGVWAGIEDNAFTDVTFDGDCDGKKI